MAKHGLRVPHQQPSQEDTPDGEGSPTEETTEETTEEVVNALPQVTVAAPAPRVTAHEKTKLVKPRVSIESFRCNGKFYTTVAGREMRVPPGVAEHMETIGIL